MNERNELEKVNDHQLVADNGFLKENRGVLTKEKLANQQLNTQELDVNQDSDVSIIYIYKTIIKSTTIFFLFQII
jgi:hypothetical protein